ncbi:hypothetical protein H8B13_00135 [Hymenobacter sp. BT188]|uniref:hypothetical protein n=1 Tax=Hymenobacter sp. BT188 TaxID=2763504 RepID=UPI001651535D|nr:hypothetical protein [Hymenobacter sp. BT188]MBC6605216.1 hypothetical protein [Hymenobacter sp. BT188]
MRAFLLSFFGVLLPHLLLAQGFQSGSCIFGNDSQTRHVGMIRLHSNYLDFKNGKGEVVKLLPEDVYRFQIGNCNFTTASGFIVPTVTAEKVMKLTFVQLLDSGQVVLMRYNEENRYAPIMGSGGSMMSYGGAYTLNTYLLQRPNEEEATSLPKNSKELRLALAPYVQNRGDLIKLLTDKRISQRNLEAFIHSLNTGQPFVDVPRTGLASEF